jgi:hypothetical protein
VAVCCWSDRIGRLIMKVSGGCGVVVERVYASISMESVLYLKAPPCCIM